jgi:hypothetical protein
VGEGLLRQEFWYRSHWIAPEADLVDTDLFGADLLLTKVAHHRRSFGETEAFLLRARLQGLMDREPTVGQRCDSVLRIGSDGCAL